MHTWHYLERPATGASPWLLVLMHGVGSNEQDLMGLAPFVPPNCHVVSVRAPFTLGPGSYAWFQFDVLPDGSRRIDTAQEEASRQGLAELVAHLQTQLDIPPERTVLAGFSQGGIMALSMLLTAPQGLRAAMLWHSRLLPEIADLYAPAAALAGKALWVSHGRQDAVIPIAQARTVAEVARGLPLALSYHEFDGQHEIPRNELDASMAWLEALTQGA